MKKNLKFLFFSAIFLSLHINLTFAAKSLANEYYDKTIPEVEIPLSSESFQSIRNRREVFEINDEDDEENVETNKDALYNIGFFEGDIAADGLSANTIKEFIGEISVPRGVSRNAVKNPLKKWPKSGEYVLIPTKINSSQYTNKSMKRIDRAMKEFHKRTCIRFIPKSSHQDYLYITQDKVCYSEEIGMKGGQQNVSLTEDCMRGGGIIHELMHAIGFYHEQSRADRDSYVTIHLENVMDDAKANFETYDLEKITHLGAGYDYESIMHYDMKAFSKNGEPTIVPKKPGVTIGQRKGFSRMDVYKINKLYECRVINEGKENVDDTDVDFTDGAISADADGANADALSKKITQGISSSCPTQYANKYIVGKTLIVIPGNLSDCCNYCKAAKGCKAYISGVSTGGLCTLKSADGPTISSAKVKMGILNSGDTCAKQNGTDIIGHNIVYILGEEHECCHFCKITSGCKAYTWEFYHGGLCELKSARGLLTNKESVTVGINDQALRDIKIANMMGQGVQVTATCFTDDSKYKENVGPIILQNGEHHWFSFKIRLPIICTINSTSGLNGYPTPKDIEFVALSTVEDFAIYFLLNEGVYRSNNYYGADIQNFFLSKQLWPGDLDSNGQVVTGDQGIIQGSCPIGWRYYQPSNKCFYIESKRMDWFQAFDECFYKNGVLAFIDSEEESEFIAKYAKEISTHLQTIWIGEPRYYNNKFSQRIFYVSTPAMDKRCYALSISQYITNTRDIGWQNSICFSNPPNHGFACGIHLEKECPWDWDYFPDTRRCFYVVTADNAGSDFISQTDAIDYCKRIGGELASVHSKEEHDFISSGFYQHGHWQWSDGSTWNYDRINNPSERRNINGDCLNGNQEDESWHYTSCDNSDLVENYICAKSSNIFQD